MNSELSSLLAHDTELINREIVRYIPRLKSELPIMAEAEEYSMQSGGKRVRPFLTLEFCRALGGEESTALPFACAVEMVHSYSLIHDDLPCMDNSDTRRGKPSSHKKFGEALAVLSGDGLLTDAFGVCASNTKLSSEKLADAVCTLSAYAGSFGMVGGQVLDLSESPKNFEQLLQLYSLKTCGLISAAVKLGCIAAGADAQTTEYALIYAENIGFTFQIIDDIIDSANGEEDLGKVTILSFMTGDKAFEYAKSRTEQGKAAISEIKNNGNLIQLADFLLSRKK